MTRRLGFTLVAVAVWLVGVGVAAWRGARLLDLAGPMEDPDPEGAALPAESPAQLWRVLEAGATDAAVLRKGLEHHPALVTSAIASPAAGTLVGHVELARAAASGPVQVFVGERLALTPAECTWAVEPALARTASALCPAPELGYLCSGPGVDVVHAQVDVVLLDALLDDDDELQAMAVETACRLVGPRLDQVLVGVGQRVTAASAAVELRLLGCRGRPEDIETLREVAGSRGALATLAALELARLGESLHSGSGDVESGVELVRAAAGR